jgi:hypothetical protein
MGRSTRTIVPGERWARRPFRQVGLGTPRFRTVSFAPMARGCRCRRRWCAGGPQRHKLARGVDILVATPGRLLDLIDTWSLSLLILNYRVPSSLSPTIRSCPSTSCLIRYRGLLPSPRNRPTILKRPFAVCSTPRSGKNSTAWPTRYLCSDMLIFRDGYDAAAALPMRC